MRSLAYKYLIWNSSWFKKHRHLASGSPESKIRQQARATARPSRQGNRLIRWLLGMSRSIH